MGQEDKNESLGPAEEGSSLFPQALGFDLGPQLVRIIQRNQQDVERKRKRSNPHLAILESKPGLDCAVT